jgi:peptidoglycan/xylan/chitin deacetylase (PgdA/CDA1 family)
VTIFIDSKTVYHLFNDNIVDTFLPKLKEQKEAERKLAEEAKRKAEEAAAQAETARNHTRQQVAANRSNINCAVMKCIALTFDDGPGAYTNQVLDTLIARNAVATFFVVGNKVASGTGVLQRAVSTHSEIANHSWSHPDFSRLSNDAIVSQVEQTNQAIFNATGSFPKLMRPPYAALDDRIRTQIGMPIALWSIDPMDWLYRDASTVYQKTIARASPGAVIILHDIHPTTVQAVPSIVDELQRQGYVLVTMSELVGINQNNLSNFVGRVIHRQ